MLLCSIFIASHKTAFSPHCIIQGTGANEKEDPAPKDRIKDKVQGDRGQEGNEGGLDEATNKEEGDIKKWKDEATDEEDCVGGGQTCEEDGRSGGQTCEVDCMVEFNGEDEDTDEDICEVDCIVGVKWGRHKHGVEKGNKPEHLFRTRWMGCDESEDTWEPLTNLNGDEISENSFSFLISPNDAQAHALKIFFH